MPGSRICAVFIVVAAALAACTAADEENARRPTSPTGQNGAAALANFDIPGRIKGKFYVELKSGEELARVAKRSDFSTQVLPNGIPTTKESLEEFATALASSAHGKVSSTLVSGKHMAFVLEDVSDDAVRSVVMKDPRVRYVEPVTQTGF